LVCRCREGNGIALIATVNNQRREIVVAGVIPKGEAPEKVKVLIIHQLGDYVKNKQTLSSPWLRATYIRDIQIINEIIKHDGLIISNENGAHGEQVLFPIE